MFHRKKWVMEVWNNSFEGVFYWSRDNIAKEIVNHGDRKRENTRGNLSLQPYFSPQIKQIHVAYT